MTPHDAFSPSYAHSSKNDDKAQTMKRLEASKPREGAPRSVLFICNMNAIRSPMAAAVTRTLFPHMVYSRSAGIQKGDKDPFFDVVMNELGVDISTHYPHTVEELNDANFDLVITLTEEAKNHALDVWDTNASDIEFWPTPDPTLETGRREQRLDAYRATRDYLIKKIKERLE